MSSTDELDVLDAVTIDLIFALRDSLTDDGPSYQEFWSGRCASALKTAAASATTGAEAVTRAAAKLQIDVFATARSKNVVAAVEVIDRDYRAWARHIDRNLTYILALAVVEREERKAKAAAKKATRGAEPSTPNQTPTF